MPARYTVLLATGPKRQAAERAIALLRAAFPDGGTWIALPSLEPTVGGWWFSKHAKKDCYDFHVQVSLDSEYGDPLDDACVKAITSILRIAYRESPEAVYYLSCQSVSVVEILGTLPEMGI